MLHPSYSELIDVLNEDADADHQITSRYSIVIAVAKRARQLVDNAPKLTDYNETSKAVSIAVNEMYNRAIKVKISKSEDELLLDESIKSMNAAMASTISPVSSEAPPSDAPEVYDNDLAEDNLYDDELEHPDGMFDEKEAENEPEDE